MKFDLNLRSLRARRARMAARIGKKGKQILKFLAFLLGPAGILLFFLSYQRIGYALGALALLAVILILWYDRDLKNLPVAANARSLDDILEPGLLAKFKVGGTITPKSAWATASKDWQGVFVLNRLLIDETHVATLLDDSADSMAAVWQKAVELAAVGDTKEVGAGALNAALLITSPAALTFLNSLNLQADDVVETYDWLERINQFLSEPKPYFGGIGRDWAAGFTPTLDRYGRNISQEVERGQTGHFQTLAHADVLDGIIHSLSQGTGAVALVGETGTGKTALVHALAQRLLLGKDPALRYYQIVSLNASLILSSSADQLERSVLTLFGEAVHARNIILFLDEAHLFFGEGTGAFDMSQILMPVLQNRSVKVIAALTPNDYQRLKTKNDALATNLGMVAVTEPSPDVTMQILEDSALSLEHRSGVLITYEAVRETYRLSGQYMQDEAYPGKAIKTLEQAIPNADGKVVTAESVQSAIEKTKGVRVSKAQAPEADMLINLEARIHERMINQERAVKVIAAALRRSRAGVGNPKRPIGSFLFLGPTGVGKTELARSLAATYFGDERQMIRLDMSEYQRPDDVARLLDGGANSEKSLILAVREQPFSVVLLDEIEKANPAVLNLLLQLLDEGQLTDQTGKSASFRNAIIITTSNAGSAEIIARVGAGNTLDDFERPLINKLIAEGVFKPELINRFDEVVLFRSLNQSELAQVAQLMLNEVNETLAKQNVSVRLTEAALAHIVEAGYDPEFGARPMRRVIQKKVEDAVANRILSGQAQAGSEIVLDVADLS